MSKSFNFVIGQRYPSGRIGAYRIGNNDLHFCDMETAQDMLEYVKAENPETLWEIFNLGN